MPLVTAAKGGEGLPAHAEWVGQGPFRGERLRNWRSQNHARSRAARVQSLPSAFPLPLRAARVGPDPAAPVPRLRVAGTPRAWPAPHRLRDLCTRLRWVPVDPRLRLLPTVRDATATGPRSAGVLVSPAPLRSEHRAPEPPGSSSCACRPAAPSFQRAEGGARTGGGEGLGRNGAWPRQCWRSLDPCPAGGPDSRIFSRHGPRRVGREARPRAR